jgi:hypothetical protein
MRKPRTPRVDPLTAAMAVALAETISHGGKLVRYDDPAPHHHHRLAARRRHHHRRRMAEAMQGARADHRGWRRHPGVPAMRIVPLILREANAFVDLHHRHSKKVRGHKWAIGMEHEGPHHATPRASCTRERAASGK